MPKRNSISRRKKSNIGTYIVVGIVFVVIAVAIVAFISYGNAGASGSTSSSSTNPQLAYLTVTSKNPVLGSKNASVTIFEFGDFQCPYCTG